MFCDFAAIKIESARRDVFLCPKKPKNGISTLEWCAKPSFHKAVEHRNGFFDPWGLCPPRVHRSDNLFRKFVFKKGKECDLSTLNVGVSAHLVIAFVSKDRRKIEGFQIHSTAGDPYDATLRFKFAETLKFL